MDLEALKKTWGRLPAEKELDENQLKQLLGGKTKNLVERIDRNIKIGFVLLFILLVVFFLDDFLLSPLMAGTEEILIPGWLKFLGVFSNMLVFTTFIYFVIKYYRVRKNFDMVLGMKETLTKIIDTLTIYQTMFYLALFALLLAIGSAFVTGLFTGLIASASESGITISQVESKRLALVIVKGLAVLTIIIVAVFMFFRWGFRKLYGNYIEKLKLALKELEEVEE